MSGKYKKCLFVCVFVLQGLLLSAQDGAAAGIQPVPKNSRTWAMAGNPESPQPPRKPVLPLRNRTFEISIAQTSVYASNVFAGGDFLRSPFRILGNMIGAGGFSGLLDDPGLYYLDDASPITIEDILKGFRSDFGGSIAPLSINVNIKDRWGFGFDFGHTVFTGNMLVPEVVLDPEKASSGTFDVGVAAFTDFAVPVFFHLGDFKVKVRPAAYVPLLYVKPDIRYDFGPVTDENGRLDERFELSYDMRIFSPFSLEGMLGGGGFDMGNMSGIGGSLGYDVSFGVEYPIYSWLSAGVDIVNLPLVPARPEHYARMSGSVVYDTGDIDPNAVSEGKADIAGGMPEINPEDTVFGRNSDTRILRPFAMLAYANYRPFRGRIVTLIPSFGFSVNRLYVRPASVEGGLSARVDLANIFATTVGVNYNDRRWRNSLDFMLNLRVIEINFGVSLQAHDFVRSFKGYGFGAGIGLKMGW